MAECALCAIAAAGFTTIASAQPDAQGVVGATQQSPVVPPLFHGLSYMTAFGPKNYGVVSLLYGVIVISLAVVAIIGGFVLVGSLWRGRWTGNAPVQSIRLEAGGSGLWYIYIGIALTFLALTATAIWNYFVLAAIANPPTDPAATIRIVGHQWWWEVQYLSAEPSRGFTTANEIHIPVGKPVRVELTTADVIHSFWVPALTGKMDTIPGQTNVTWMQADRPGIYRGQCTQFCGHQHALMAFLVTAESPQDFQAWWNRQLQAPQAPREEAASIRFHDGEQAFIKNCAVCHSIRGTPAGGKVGPNLSHLAGRKSLGAGTLPNSIGNLSGWIANPQQVKPGNFMPTLDLSAADLVSVRDYLETLN